MRHGLVLLAVLALGAVQALAQAPVGLTDFHASGVAVDLADGKLIASVQRCGVGKAVVVDRFRLAVPYKPGPGLLMSPVTTVLDAAIELTELSVGRIALDLKPLEQAGVALPGGFIGSLIRAQLEAFDTRDLALSIRAGKVTFAVKSGIVHSKLEGALGWGEGAQLAFRVDALRLNFGLPVPRKILMKRLAFLDPLDWCDVRENTIIVDVARLAKLVAESLPKQAHWELKQIGGASGAD